MPVELRLLEDSIEASQVRVAANLPKDISHIKGTELGRSILAFREDMVGSMNTINGTVVPS